MESVLSALYHGKLCPAEQYTYRTEEYRKVHQEHYQHYDNFMQTLKELDPPLDQQFMKIMDEQLNLLPLEYSETFMDGFRLGARLMMDIFQGEFDKKE